MSKFILSIGLVFVLFSTSFATDYNRSYFVQQRVVNFVSPFTSTTYVAVPQLQTFNTINTYDSYCNPVQTQQVFQVKQYPIVQQKVVVQQVPVVQKQVVVQQKVVQQKVIVQKQVIRVNQVQKVKKFHY